MSTQSQTTSEKETEEDFLKQYINETDVTKTNESEFTMPEGAEQFDTNRAVDLQYFAFDVKIFPLGKFYPEGTKILIRAAQVREIQAYSMVDDNNFYDIVEKMNDMISACVRIQYTNKSTPSTYLDLKDGDRFYTIFLIRELTFQKGSSLAVKSKCTCKTDNEISLERKNFSFHETDIEIKPFFNLGNKKFCYTTTIGTKFEVGTPTIGLQKSFTEYIVKEAREKREPNMSFLKIIPFIISDMNSITEEGINKYLEDFENLEDDDFQFLNAAVDKMKFGISELKKDCSCGLEVRTDFVFPNGASGIFVIRDAFKRFIKK